MTDMDGRLSRFGTIILATDGTEFSGSAGNVAPDRARCGGRV
jgi:hypothetical protein